MQDLHVSKNEHGSKRLLCHHHFGKLLIVDLTIPINVCFADHFIHLLISQLLTQVRHHMSQLKNKPSLMNDQNKAHLSGGDETIAIFIEDLERLLELVFVVAVLSKTVKVRSAENEWNRPSSSWP